MKIEFTAFPRNHNGTGPSRRMRRTGRVPGVVYGGGKQSQPIELDHHALARHLKMESFHASILDMSLEGARERVLLRDVQMHPWKTEVLHVDFQRVAADRKIHMKVPLHFINAAVCPGVKEGGVVSHVMNDVDIQCLPDNLPEYVEVDLAQLDLGDSIHLNELKMPEGVEPVARLRADNPVVVTVTVPRAAVEETVAEAAAGTTEIITEKPAEAAGGADKEKK
ncbi:MAG: 50S ribosomal protein L25/general stress protein Ctc [Betaproteobacteria bacterium]|nr:MAG: 50S ribosomal protein L25/general stress protein Ctc [Betaproteobacteria bacterium]